MEWYEYGWFFFVVLAGVVAIVRSSPSDIGLAPLVDLYRALLRSRTGFGEWLGMLDNRTIVTVSADEVEMHIDAVPTRWCADASSPLSLGVVLALFDEVSTMGLMHHDKSHRAGVSVLLAGAVDTNERERFEALTAGSSLTVRSRSRRIGRTLGFCDVTLSADGVVVVRGEHVKFMPVGGRVWDVAFGSALYAWTVPLATWLLKRRRRRRSAAPPVGDASTFAAVFPSNADGAFAVQKTHHNVSGVCHGGAVAVAAAEAARRALAPRRGARAVAGGGARRARALRVVYLSASKGTLDIATELTGEGEARAVVRRVARGGKMVECATVVSSWD